MSQSSKLVPRINVAIEKRAAFFAVRIFLATISVLVEATFFRSIADRINDRVGRYHFFLMFFSAGMWNASTGVSDPNSFLSNSSNNFCSFSSFHIRHVHNNAGLLLRVHTNKYEKQAPHPRCHSDICSWRDYWLAIRLGSCHSFYL
jgi:hypothetical protein